jgi:hypothetical protein
MGIIISHHYGIQERNAFMTDIDSFQTEEHEEELQNRFGRAVLALIAGIFAMTFLILFVPNLFMRSKAAVLWLILSIIFSLVGFVTGLSARRTTKGRGLAVAGITLTAIPLLMMVAMPIFSVIYYLIAG